MAIRILTAISIAAALLLSGCAALEEAQPAEQIIIRFVDSVAEPSDSEFIAQTTQISGATLIYQRQLATGAHLFSVRYPDKNSDLSSVLQRLRQWDQVIYAESDRRALPNSRVKPALN